VQVRWRTISRGRNFMMDDVLGDHDDDASFWELALICQSSSHLYLWCSDGCASVAFPKLNTSTSSDATADMSSIKTDRPFLVRDVQWMDQSTIPEHELAETIHTGSKTCSKHQKASSRKALIATDAERFVICYPNQTK
jgi:hypothetical protein